MTAATLAAIESASTVRLRTSRHPSASVVDAESYDHLYESLGSFDAVYAAIVEDLVSLAAGGDVLYLVPGAPTVSESTVERLRARDDVECVLLPAMSFLDLTWARLGIDPVEQAVRLADGHVFEEIAPRLSGSVLVSQCSSNDVLAEMKVAFDREPDRAIVLHHLGLDDEAVVEVAWDEIDRAVEADHLTSLFIPEVPAAEGSAVLDFAVLVRRLRAECPWDREQTHASLRPHLVEETYEVIEALDTLSSETSASNTSASETSAAGEERGAVMLEEELGDLLFQILFHTTLASEVGGFDLDDVTRGIHEKLVRRHPHVFDPGGDHPSWDELKRQEKAARGEQAPTGVLDDITPLPTLEHAVKVATKAAKSGFEWPSADGAWAKFDEEVGELRAAASAAEVEHELGDVMFSLLSVARHLGAEPEVALRAAVRRFRDRFGLMERSVRAGGATLDSLALDELLSHWDRAKDTLDG